ncbi:MAG: sel1 repeat family protein [Desulfovibrio sp.]|nr:sel1 repeat family protein [Desulfovibrio sp.]
MRRTAKPFGLLAVTALLLLPAPLHAEPGACDYAEARRLDDLEVPQARATLEICARQGQLCARARLTDYDGGELDSRQAAELLQALKEEGGPESLECRALVWNHALHSPENGRPLLERACREGQASACGTLGAWALNGQGMPQNGELAASSLRKAGAATASALYHLGTCYEQGIASPRDPLAAAMLYRKAAERGHQRAAFSLALCYQHGKGVVKAPGLAFDWFLKAAERGSLDACEALGHCLADGFGRPKDLQAACAWWRRGAVEGHPGCQCSYGTALLRGDGAAKDEAEAASWLEKAAKAGSVKAQVNLALALHQGIAGRPEPKEAAYWFLKAAEAGNAQAQNNLAVYYSKGLGGLPCDKALSLHWLKKAADGGDPMALLALGKAYRDGSAGAQDLRRAHECFLKAGEQGDAEALFLAGQDFEEGLGAPRDPGSALDCYRKAGKLGLARAKFAAGRLLMEGLGAPRDTAKAEVLLVEGASRSAEEASGPDGARLAALLGIFYHDGRLGRQDFAKARAWFEKAAALGSGQAMNNLGFYFQEGLGGLERDEAKALELYRKAADAGDREAQYFVALQLLEGTRLPRDATRALALLEASAADGEGKPEAAYRLGQCYEQGEGAPKDPVRALRWFGVAASMDYPPALLKEGLLRLAGTGAPKNLQAASALIFRAASFGLPEAQRLAGQLCEAGEGVEQSLAKARQWYAAAAEQGDAEAARRLKLLEEAGSAGNAAAPAQTGQPAKPSQAARPEQP